MIKKLMTLSMATETWNPFDLALQRTIVCSDCNHLLLKPRAEMTESSGTRLEIKAIMNGEGKPQVSEE